MLPFTHDEFLSVFATYNQAVWPGQLVAYVVGICVVAAARSSTPRAGSAAAAGLAVMWLWTGAAYHLRYFSAINPAAYAFGALFVVQGLLFAWIGWSGQLAFGQSASPRGALGWSLIAYSMFVYPLLGMAVGASYPAMPMFGIAPCPVTLFTLGVLLLATRRVPRWLLIVPILWAVIGGTAAFLLSMVQDWILLFSALAALPIAMSNPQAASAQARAP